MTLLQWFICIRLYQTHLTCLHAFSPDASHPSSLLEQPRSDLNPIPENRVRGAYPHPTYSIWLLLPGCRHFLAHCEHGLHLFQFLKTEFGNVFLFLGKHLPKLDLHLYQIQPGDTSQEKQDDKGALLHYGSYGYICSLLHFTPQGAGNRTRSDLTQGARQVDSAHLHNRGARKTN